MQKLFGPGKNISLVPASGPAPVVVRLEEWFTLVPEYERLSAVMEQDAAMVKQLGEGAWLAASFSRCGSLLLLCQSLLGMQLQAGCME